GHAFDAPGHEDLSVADHDGPGRVHDGLKGGGTKSVDGGCRRRDGKAAKKADIPGHIHALFTFGHGAADNDVLNVGGIQALDPLDRLFHHNGSPVVDSPVDCTSLTR